MNWERLAARIAWWLGALARYPRYAWRLVRRPRRVRLHGIWLELPADATPALRRALYAERYERGEARCVLLRLAPDDVVLEIGAGLGFIGTLCALRVGSERVTSYEANPALLPLIRVTHSANGVAPALVHGVLAREAGSAELFVERELVSSSLQRRSAEAAAVRVPQLAVNDEIRRVRPSCLVMDIEGAEAELLPVIAWDGIRKLILELHPHVIGGARTRELLELLGACGFREERGISTTRKKYFAREAGVTLGRVTTPSGPILLFDGVCNLCNSTVQWVIAHDPEARFRFASLQSEAGRALLAAHGLPLDAMDTVVLVDGDAHWVKSDAGLQMLRRIGGAFGPLAALRIVPRPLRDAVYGWIVANRYRWFGKREECWIPTPELRARFLA